MMKLSSLPGAVMAAPPDGAAVQRVERGFGFALPAMYLELLKESNGVSSDRCLIYGTDEILERNETLEVKVYAPDFLAIGDDGGGRVALIDRTSRTQEVFVSGAGDMDPTRFTVVAAGLEDWVRTGCPFEPLP
jgi:hypothetical protein